jgi:hypothetical protein
METHCDLRSSQDRVLTKLLGCLEIHSFEPLWCLTPVFADDGTTVKKNPPVEDVCSSDEQTWSITNDLGVLYQEKNSLTGVSACYQKLWDNIFLGWKTIEATCP